MELHIDGYHFTLRTKHCRICVSRSEICDLSETLKNSKTETRPFKFIISPRRDRDGFFKQKHRNERIERPRSRDQDYLSLPIRILCQFRKRKAAKKYTAVSQTGSPRNSFKLMNNPLRISNADCACARMRLEEWWVASRGSVTSLKRQYLPTTLPY